MRLKQFSLYIICFFLVLQSCTVEKRLHKRGYYVEWKSFRKFENKAIEKKDLSNSVSEITTAPEEIKTSIDEIQSEQIVENQKNIDDKDVLIEENQNSDLEQKKNSYSNENTNSKSNNQSVTKSTVFKKKATPYLKEKDTGKNSKQNKLAIIGLALVLSSLLLFPLVIAGYYVCAVALRQIKRKPNAYSNKYLGLIGYILAIVFLTLIFVIFTALFLFVGTMSLPALLYIISAYLGIIVSGSIIINT